MLRVSFTVILMTLLAACTSVPAPTSSPVAIVTENPSTEPTASLPTSEATSETQTFEENYQIQEYAVPPGTHPHDVAPAPEGSV